jgi:6-phosphogluconolactonase
MNRSKMDIAIFHDPEALARHVAAWLTELAVGKEGRFAIALSGGSTPKRLYQLLAEAPYRDQFPWPRVHWFWGDERFVPPDDAQSNYRMVHEALLSHAAIPAANIHAVPTVGMTPDEAATAYDRELRAFYGGGELNPARPLFDVNLLGLGEDGHTASLFPGTAALDEGERWVVAVVGAKAEARITLTYPALDSSRHTAFLIAGAAKQPMFDRLRGGDQTIPAGRLDPVGHTYLFADTAAAGRTV